MGTALETGAGAARGELGGTKDGREAGAPISDGAEVGILEVDDGALAVGETGWFAGATTGAEREEWLAAMQRVQQQEQGQGKWLAATPRVVWLAPEPERTLLAERQTTGA